MTSFTKFSSEANVVYSYIASKTLEKDHWVVTKDFEYKVGNVDSNEVVQIPRGFLTDGASVPRAFWSLIPPWGEHGQAAILHDYLCEYSYTIKDGLINEIDRKAVDKIFLEALKVLKVSRFKRYLMFYAVRTYSFLIRNKVNRQIAKKIQLENDYRNQ